MDSTRAMVVTSCCAPDDDALLNDNVNADLGTVQIEMMLVQRYERKKKSQSLRRHVPDIGPLHERSKKAGVHATA